MSHAVKENRASEAAAFAVCILSAIAFTLTFTLFPSQLVHADVLYAETQVDAQSESAPLHLWVDPEKVSKGVVVLVHGLSEHAGSLDVLARELANDGYFTIGIDQRGHGNWHVDSRKGERGYLCDFKKTVKDLDKTISQIDTCKSGLPVFLIGESLGSSVALRAAVDNPDRIRGLILCSCGAKLNKLKTSWMLRDLAAGLVHPGKEINIEKYQYEYACENSNVVTKALADKKVRTGFRPGEIISSRRFFAGNIKYAKRLNPDTKLLILAGTEDKLISSKAYEKLLQSASPADKTLSYISSRGHMMIGRPDLSLQAKSAMFGWLDNKLGNKIASRDKTTQ